MKEILVMAMVSASVIMGFVGCEKQHDVNTIITQENFYNTTKGCQQQTTGAKALVDCVHRTFDPKVQEYCSVNKLPADECSAVQGQVNLKMADYNRENTKRLEKQIEEYKEK